MTKSRAKPDPNPNPSAFYVAKDFEQAALATILTHEDRWPWFGSLHVDDFAHYPHRAIFHAMLRVVEDGNLPDFLHVKADLATQAAADIGAADLLELTNGGIPIISTETLARDVVSEIQIFTTARRARRLFADGTAALDADPRIVGNGFFEQFLTQLEHCASFRLRADIPITLETASIVTAEGAALEQDSVRYLVDGLIPNYGMLGFDVAYARVGKTTFSQQLGAAVAMGRPFLGRATTRAKALIIAAEDPPEYTAWLARHLHGAIDPPNQLQFYRAPILLNADGLSRIATSIREHEFGLVLISSWQAVIRGLLKDENDNAGAVAIVEAVKAVVRNSGIPWVIDAHSGKGEDQSEEADPTRALRGASGAVGAADFVLSLRYVDGAFGNRRRLSGKGRFVSFAPIVIAFDPTTSRYDVVASDDKHATRETTWRLIVETGAVTASDQTADSIAKTIGLTDKRGKATTTGRRRVQDALHQREGIIQTKDVYHGKLRTLYRLGSDGERHEHQ